MRSTVARALARALGVGAVALLVERLARGGEAAPQLAVAHLAGRRGRLPALEQVAEALRGLGVARRRGEALGLLRDRGAQHLGERALVLAREHDLLGHLGGRRLLGGDLVVGRTRATGGSAAGLLGRGARRSALVGAGSRHGLGGAALVGDGLLGRASATGSSARGAPRRHGLLGHGLLGHRLLGAGASATGASSAHGLLGSGRLVGRGLLGDRLATGSAATPRRTAGASATGSSDRTGIGLGLLGHGLLGGDRDSSTATGSSLTGSSVSASPPSRPGSITGASGVSSAGDSMLTGEP